MVKVKFDDLLSLMRSRGYMEGAVERKQKGVNVVIILFYNIKKF